MASYGRGEFDGGFDSYQSGGGARGGGGVGEFQRLNKVVTDKLQKMSHNVSQIEKMVDKVGTPQDSDRLRDDLHDKTHYTNQLAKEVTSLLKDLSKSVGGVSQSEQRQRKMQNERLVGEFSDLLNRFQKTQRLAAEKEKDSVKRARTHSGFGGGGLYDEPRGAQMMDYSADRSQQQVLQMEEDVDLELIQEREAAIKQLESDIMDVNTIFKDLGMLVHEQGEVIDSIESNVESAQMQVESGTQQLASAREYQSKARRKKFCICLILFIVLAVLALIIGLSVGLKN